MHKNLQIKDLGDLLEQAKLLREGALEMMRRRAVLYLGSEQGNALIEAMGGGELVCIRIEPGVLRIWDFADEYSS